jgi:hypothetical protein
LIGLLPFPIFLVLLFKFVVERPKTRSDGGIEAVFAAEVQVVPQPLGGMGSLLEWDVVTIQGCLIVPEDGGGIASI